MAGTDSQPFAENEQVKELLHMKGGIRLDQEPLPQIHLNRDTDLSVFAYELHIFEMPPHFVIFRTESINSGNSPVADLHTFFCRTLNGLQHRSDM